MAQAAHPEVRRAAQPPAAAWSFAEAVTRMLIDGVFGCQSRLSTNSTSRGVGERIYRLQEGRPALRYNLKKRIYDVISCLWMILTHHASGLISLLRAEENS